MARWADLHERAPFGIPDNFRRLTPRVSIGARWAPGGRIHLGGMDELWIAVFAIVVVGVWITVSRFHRGGWFRRRLDGDSFRPSSRTLCVPKPRWVTRELIRLKAHHPKLGCRSIAILFNRRFAERGMRVGKTFVADLLRARKLEIASLRRQWKRRKPKALPRNAIWGMDLTGITDAEKETSTVLGIIDHGSRLAIDLRVVQTKASTVLVRVLLDSIDRFGKPKAARTDNEAVFCSWVFRLSLFLLGIRHQKTQVHSPWQNGRVERFFGTLKRVAKQVKFENRALIAQAMETFRFWYNQVRPHQNLGGRTPGEAWRKVDPYALPVRWSRPFQAWDGVLIGQVITHGRRCQRGKRRKMSEDDALPMRWGDAKSCSS